VNSRVTGALPTECPTCRGFGCTEETRPVMVMNPFTGLQQSTAIGDGGRKLIGSGCPRCGGTGQLAHAHP
jgi:DnaJ-class molecular chaperone